MASVKPKPMLVKDWNRQFAGRYLVLVGLQGGTLCGYVADGDRIARVLVAFTPEDRRWFDAQGLALLPR